MAEEAAAETEARAEAAALEVPAADKAARSVVTVAMVAQGAMLVASEEGWAVEPSVEEAKPAAA